jgi:PAS domain S-box-containing protein
MATDRPKDRELSPERAWLGLCGQEVRLIESVIDILPEPVVLIPFPLEGIEGDPFFAANFVANWAARKLMGLALESGEISASPRAFNIPQLAALEHPIKQALRGLEGEGDYLCSLSDGHTIVLHVWYHPIRMAGRRIEGCLLRLNESNRHKGDFAEENNQRPEPMVGQIPAIVWSTDIDLNITYCSGTGLDAIAGLPGQILGLPISSVFPEAGNESLTLAKHRIALLGGQATYKYQTQDRTFDVTVHPAYAEGAIAGVAGLAVDVTDRKAVHGSASILHASPAPEKIGDLRTSHEVFSRAFNARSNPISLNVLKDGRYLFVNEAFLTATQYSRGEVLGKTPFELGIWNDAGEQQRLAVLLREHGFVKDIQMRCRTKAGHEQPFLVSIERVTVGSERCVMCVGNSAVIRNEYEDARRARAERYRVYVEQSMDGIWRLEFEHPIAIDQDEESQIQQMLQLGYLAESNDVMARMYGYSRAEELIGARLSSHLPLPNATDSLKVFVHQGYRSMDYESNEVDRNGNEVCFANNVVGIIENGLLVRIWGTQRNVTGRRKADRERTELLRSEKAARREAQQADKLRAEMLLREQAARAEAEAARLEWQRTFDAMAEAVMLVDQQGCLVRANKAFFEMTGVESEASLGQQVMNLHGPGWVDNDDCPLCQLRSKGGGVVELPAGVITSFPVIASVDPIRDNNGNIIGFVQELRNLSDLYKAREEAERERVSLSATIEQMAEGLLVFDPEGVVIKANRQAQTLFGFTFDEMQNDRERTLASGRFSDLNGNILSLEELPVPTALREMRVIDSVLLWYQRPEGQPILLSIVASPFVSEQGKPIGAVALIRDITKQQREHERIQQSDKLRALGQLASGVAHNFNNALASILGYAQLTRRKTRDPEMEKNLIIIEQSAQDAARMVERIQNFSRSTPRSEDFTPVLLVEVVRDAIEISGPRWRSDAESLGIQYNVSLVRDSDDEIIVNGEQSELREVFLNIILNALDAMPAGGSLTIRTFSTESTACVSFSDTGFGMTEEIKNRAFEPFFTTKEAAGLGMGLSESYQIVERHGGRIEIQTQLNHGTTFTVELPVNRTGEHRQAKTSEIVVSNSARVLVVDDEQFVRTALCAMLSELGHEVSAASGVDEALGLAEQQEFDLAFTDLAMPRVDGIATATLLKQRWPKVKIILMSGYGFDTAGERAKNSDAIAAVISKPFSLAEIQEITEATLKKEAE